MVRVQVGEQYTPLTSIDVSLRRSEALLLPVKLPVNGSGIQSSAANEDLSPSKSRAR
ncbi:hypothetical protein AERO9AM_50051 [Aeromicrobium sp. 9AM]|nr:hypothetical protein AERO9AM_50051 [Aeromicrobium sp. 9AM]